MINEVSTILIDVLTEPAFQVIDRCAWLYHICWANVGKIKDIYSSFQQTLLTEYETNINQIRVLFDGYTVESTKGWEQKSRKKNLVSVEMKAHWNLPIPQNMKNTLTSSSKNQQLIDLFDDADMLIQMMQTC